MVMLLIVDASDAIADSLKNCENRGVSLIEDLSFRLATAQKALDFDELAVVFDGDFSYRTEIFPSYRLRYSDTRVHCYAEQLQAWLVSVGAAWFQLEGFETVDLAGSIIERRTDRVGFLGRHRLSVFFLDPTEQVEIYRGVNLTFGDERCLQRLTWQEFATPIWRCSKNKWFRFSLEDFYALTGVGRLKASETSPALAQLLLDEYGDLEGLADAYPDIRLCGQLIKAGMRRRVEKVLERRFDLRACLRPRRDAPVPDFDLTAPDLGRFLRKV